MRKTYIASSNSATNGVALGDAGVDVTLWKLVVGAPVSAGNITIYDISNPVGGASTNIASKITFPSFSTTNINSGPQIINFGPEGLDLDGGNIIIDQTMQVTAIWNLSSEKS